jgi:hypothetical protein
MESEPLAGGSRKRKKTGEVVGKGLTKGFGVAKGIGSGLKKVVKGEDKKEKEKWNFADCLCAPVKRPYNIMLYYDWFIFFLFCSLFYLYND